MTYLALLSQEILAFSSTSPLWQKYSSLFLLITSELLLGIGLLVKIEFWSSATIATFTCGWNYPLMFTIYKRRFLLTSAQWGFISRIQFAALGACLICTRCTQMTSLPKSKPVHLSPFFAWLKPITGGGHITSNIARNCTMHPNTYHWLFQLFP